MPHRKTPHKPPEKPEELFPAMPQTSQGTEHQALFQFPTKFVRNWPCMWRDIAVSCCTVLYNQRSNCPLESVSFYPKFMLEKWIGWYEAKSETRSWTLKRWWVLALLYCALRREAGNGFIIRWFRNIEMEVLQATVLESSLGILKTVRSTRSARGHQRHRSLSLSVWGNQANLARLRWSCFANTDCVLLFQTYATFDLYD